MNTLGRAEENVSGGFYKDWRDHVFVSNHSLDQLRFRCGCREDVRDFVLKEAMGLAVMGNNDSKDDYEPLIGAVCTVVIEENDPVIGNHKKAFLVVGENDRDSDKNKWSILTVLDQKEYDRRLYLSRFSEGRKEILFSLVRNGFNESHEEDLIRRAVEQTKERIDRGVGGFASVSRGGSSFYSSRVKFDSSVLVENEFVAIVVKSGVSVEPPKGFGTKDELSSYIEEMILNNGYSPEMFRVFCLLKPKVTVEF